MRSTRVYNNKSIWLDIWKWIGELDLYSFDDLVTQAKACASSTKTASMALTMTLCWLSVPTHSWWRTMRGIMRQNETDIFLYSRNCQRVFDQFDVRGHAENANIRNRRIHSFEFQNSKQRDYRKLIFDLSTNTKCARGYFYIHISWLSLYKVHINGELN